MRHRSGVTEELRTARLARDATHRAVMRGEIVKPEVCDKCSAPTPRRMLCAYLVDDEQPSDVTWLCRRCYRSVRPTKRRKQVLVDGKCPDYQVMKADYVAGMPLAMMAEKYGVKRKQIVWHTLRSRARARDEWPLPRPDGMVQANALWDLVKAIASQQHSRQVQQRLATEPVWVAQQAANVYAPRCRVGGKHKESWSTEVPVYHLLPCFYARLSYDLFPIDSDEAEDWGYMPCTACIIDFHVNVFGRKVGLDGSLTKRIESGRTRRVTFRQARAMLRSVDEPIPDTLYLPYELEIRREQRQIYNDYLRHQHKALKSNSRS